MVMKDMFYLVTSKECDYPTVFQLFRVTWLAKTDHYNSLFVILLIWFVHVCRTTFMLMYILTFLKVHAPLTSLPIAMETPALIIHPAMT